MKKLVSLKSRPLILNAFQTSACNEQKGNKCPLFNVVYTDSGSSFCIVCYEHVGQCCIRDLIDPAPHVLNCGCSGFALMHSGQYCVSLQGVHYKILRSADSAFIGLFAKLRKATIGFFRPSVCPHRTRFPLDGFS